MSDIFEQLAAPFPPHRVHWRIGATSGDKTKGIALAYIDSRDVMERLDGVVGPGDWQARYPHANSKTCCEIGIKIGDEWVWKSDGAGDTDVEGAKGAFSDAFKRAAVHWGIGRYLYAIDSPWVEIEQAGRSYRIKRSELDRLAKILGGDGSTFGATGTTELKKAARAFATDLAACGDEDSLTALLSTTRELQDAVMRQLPSWYYGQGDSEGMEAAIARRKRELKQAGELEEAY